MRPIGDDHCLTTLNLIKIAAQAAFYFGYVGIYHMTITVSSISTLTRSPKCVVLLENLLGISDHLDTRLVDQKSPVGKAFHGSWIVGD